jgi:hypothetical protein
MSLALLCAGKKSGDHTRDVCTPAALEPVWPATAGIWQDAAKTTGKHLLYRWMANPDIRKGHRRQSTIGYDRSRIGNGRLPQGRRTFHRPVSPQQVLSGSFLGAKSTSILDCVSRSVGRSVCPHDAITWKTSYVAINLRRGGGRGKLVTWKTSYVTINSRRGGGRGKLVTSRFHFVAILSHLGIRWSPCFYQRLDSCPLNLQKLGLCLNFVYDRSWNQIL